MDKTYDVIVVGAGPTGMTSAMFAGRANLKTLLIERMLPGGQIATTSTVENYPGYPDGIEGPDLSDAMMEHAKQYGIENLSAEVLGIQLDGADRIVQTDEGDMRAKAVIITSGADHNRLGVPGEMQYMGKGVSNCAVCDGAFFADTPVAVVGGGDAALDEGLFLTRYASKVSVIHRRRQLRASKILQDRALAHPKMEFIWDTAVESIDGQNVVDHVKTRNLQTGAEGQLDVEGVFIYIGLSPNTDYSERAAAHRHRRPPHCKRPDGDRHPRYLRRRRHPAERRPPGGFRRGRRRYGRHVGSGVPQGTENYGVTTQGT